MKVRRISEIPPSPPRLSSFGPNYHVGSAPTKEGVLALLAPLGASVDSIEWSLTGMYGGAVITGYSGVYRGTVAP